MLFRKKQLPKIISSLDECSVYVFFKIMETGNTALLGDNTKPLVKEWEALVKEYLKATGNSTINNNNIKRGYLLKLLLKYDCLCNAYVIAICDDYWSAKELTDKLGYNFDLYDIEKMQSVINELKSLIDIKTAELIKDNSKVDTKQKFNIYETLEALEHFKGFKLDAKTLSMSEFIVISAAFKKHQLKKQDNGRG